jgi:hypothetical protein
LLLVATGIASFDIRRRQFHSRIGDRFVKRLLNLAFLVACLETVSCQKQRDFGGWLIDTPGTFSCFNDQLVIKVVESIGDKLNYSVGNKKISAGPPEHALLKSAPWIIFPESIDKVWIFDGGNDVMLIELSSDGGAKFTSNQVVPGLLKRAPAELLRKLPAGIVHSFSIPVPFCRSQVDRDASWL